MNPYQPGTPNSVANDPYAAPGAQPHVSWDERIRRSSALIPAMALLLLVLLGLAGTLVARQVDREPGGVFGARVQPVDAQSAPVMSPQAIAAAGTAGNGVSSSAPVMAPTVAAAPVQRALPPVRRAPVAAVAAPVCASCGVIESVVSVQRTAPGSGVGAVAGGVVGGLLGNQVGGGNGRKAMTVIGAVGGGFAGNAIEKNMKKQTVYQVNVRMDDGSLRTVEQATAPARGSRVVVEGNTLRAA